MELQSGLIMLDGLKRRIMYDSGDVEGGGLLVVAGSKRGPCSVNNGGSLSGWLMVIMGQTLCLKNASLARLPSCCCSSQP